MAAEGATGFPAVSIGKAAYDLVRGRGAKTSKTWQDEYRRIWNDPVALQREADIVEARLDAPYLGATGKARTLARLGGLNRRLDRLESQSTGDFENPTPDFGTPPNAADQDASPVIAGAAAGIIGGFEKTKQLILKALYKTDRKRARAKADKAERDLFRKLAKPGRGGVDPFGKIAAELAKKIGKRELGGAIKIATKVAKIGAKAPKVGGIAGTAIGIGGQFAIEAVDKALAKRQFAEMERILKSTGTVTAKVASKGPTTRAAGKQFGNQKIEPPRPRALRGPRGTSAGAAPPAKAPKPLVNQAPAPIAAQKPRVPFATPGQIAGTPPNRKVQAIITAAKGIAVLSRGAQIGGTLFAKPQGSSRSFLTNNLAPTTQARSSLASRLESSPVTTGTGSGCYTVCRKPNSGKKKRKSPRICVTPAQAKKAGLNLGA